MTLDALAVLRRSLSVLGANLLPFLALAVLVFAPVLVVSLIVGPGNPVRTHAAGDVAGAEIEHSPFAGQFVVGMLAFLAHWVLAGALAYGVLEHLRGLRVGTLESVQVGMARLLPVLDAGFVTGVLVGIGFLLFVVPGLFLASMWYVAVPAAVVEKPGALGALARSASLTRGSRVPILVVLLATLGLMFLVGVVVPMLLADAGRTLATTLGAVAQLLLGLYGAVCQTVAYDALRTAKEHTSAADLVDALDDPDSRD